MNDALRLLARFLRRYGYDIKRHNQYNLLPITNLAEFNQISVLYKNTNQDKKDNAAANLDKLHVCLRTCLREDTQKNRPANVAGSSNQEMVLRCIHSLIGSINHAVNNRAIKDISLVVFDDHSDPGNRASIEKICSLVKCRWEIKTTDEPGQGQSLLEQFEFARKENALFYFCEDDYLHEESAVAEMCRFYHQVFGVCGTHLVIHPQEHHFLYTRHIYPSYLLLGEQRHWRTISHATHTLFTHSNIVAGHWQYFENTRFVGDRKNRRLGVESRTTNHLFDLYPGFAPVPALAAHMQTRESLPPFFNWQKLWDNNKPD